MAFCVSACQDDAEIILFSGSELVDETGTCTNTVSSTVLYLNGWEAENIRIAMEKVATLHKVPMKQDSNSHRQPIMA